MPSIFVKYDGKRASKMSAGEFSEVPNKKTQEILCVLPSIFGKYDGKRANKMSTGEFSEVPFCLHAEVRVNKNPKNSRAAQFEPPGILLVFRKQNREKSLPIRKFTRSLFLHRFFYLAAEHIAYLHEPFAGGRVFFKPVRNGADDRVNVFFAEERLSHR